MNIINGVSSSQEFSEFDSLCEELETYAKELESNHSHSLVVSSCRAFRQTVNKIESLFKHTKIGAETNSISKISEVFKKFQGVSEYETPLIDLLFLLSWKQKNLDKVEELIDKLSFSDRNIQAKRLIRHLLERGLEGDRGRAIAIGHKLFNEKNPLGILLIIKHDLSLKRVSDADEVAQIIYLNALSFDLNEEIKEEALGLVLHFAYEFLVNGCPDAAESLVSKIAVYNPLKIVKFYAFYAGTIFKITEQHFLDEAIRLALRFCVKHPLLHSCDHKLRSVAKDIFVKIFKTVTHLTGSPERYLDLIMVQPEAFNKGAEEFWLTPYFLRTITLRYPDGKVNWIVEDYPVDIVVQVVKRLIFNGLEIFTLKRFALFQHYPKVQLLSFVSIKRAYEILDKARQELSRERFVVVSSMISLSEEYLRMINFAAGDFASSDLVSRCLVIEVRKEGQNHPQKNGCCTIC